MLPTLGAQPRPASFTGRLWPWGQHSNKLWVLRTGEVRHGDTLLVKLDEAVAEGTEVLVG